MCKVSIVTPTFFRNNELCDYFNAIENQSYYPHEVILVDGAPIEEIKSEILIREKMTNSTLNIKYYRHSGGTAIQRNYGVTHVTGDFVLFLDDDVRIQKDFIERILFYFKNDENKKIGGITGYRSNCYFSLSESKRWYWYKKLNLLSTYDPGKYDRQTGIPVNNNGQFTFSGIREVDFMTTACTMYRKEIFDHIHLDPFFVGYGILEDAHFSLRVKYHLGKSIFQCGDALCIELSSPSGRSNSRLIGLRTVSNYYYTFKSVFGPLNNYQKFRFVRFQLFEWSRSFADIIRFRNKKSILYFLGKSEGLINLIIKK